MPAHTVPMPPEMKNLLRKQLESFEAKFDHPPGLNDPEFFDPDEDTPTVQLEKTADIFPGEKVVLMMVVGIQDICAGRLLIWRTGENT